MNNIVELKTKTEIKEGVYQDMPFSQYNELDAIRSHDLTSFTKDPYTWKYEDCLLYTSPSPRDGLLSRMPSSA